MLLNNNTIDPIKLLPMHYPWAYEHYITGQNNNWFPKDSPMMDDIELWKGSVGLTDDERKMVIWNLGFFSTAESLTANNLILALYEHLNDPSIRLYLLRQAYEESVHSQSFVYICDSLGLDPNSIYNMYKDIPSIKAKDEFVTSLTWSIFKKNFKVNNDENIRELLRDLVGFYIILEGINFYGGFAMMLAMKWRKKLMAIGEQFDWIRKDEAIHVSFGTKLIEVIRQENPGVWNHAFNVEVSNLIQKAVSLEEDYVDDCIPNGIIGLTPTSFKQYIRYIADRRLESLDLPIIYKTKNPFLWMTTMNDLPVEKNFFEKTITDYRTGLEWEDD